MLEKYWLPLGKDWIWIKIILIKILVNNQLDAQFFLSYIFIPVLYMFTAPLCSSLGEPVVLIRHLVYVTPCR